jgi:hypothetical protein
VRWPPRTATACCLRFEAGERAVARTTGRSKVLDFGVGAPSGAGPRPVEAGRDGRSGVLPPSTSHSSARRHTLAPEQLRATRRIGTHRRVQSRGDRLRRCCSATCRSAGVGGRSRARPGVFACRWRSARCRAASSRAVRAALALDADRRPPSPQALAYLISAATGAL